MPSGSTRSKAEQVLPAGTHAQNAQMHHMYTYVHTETRRSLAIQIPRLHGLSGRAGTPRVPPAASLSHGLPLTYPRLKGSFTHFSAWWALEPTCLLTLAPAAGTAGSRQPRCCSSWWHIRPQTPFSPVAAITGTQDLQPCTGHSQCTNKETV